LSIVLKTAAVIIVNWNGKKHLDECLRAVIEQDFNDFRIIVVDNGSTDGSVDFVKRRFPQVTLIPLAWNTGFCRGNNVALETVREPFVALLNNDAVPESSWLGTLVAALEENREAGFAASLMLCHRQPKVIDRAGDGYTTAGVPILRKRGRPASEAGQKAWVFGASAGAAIYRMAMLNRVGFFDEDFFLLQEDVDLSFRAQLMGYRCLYVPEARVYHHGSTSIIHDSPLSVYYGHRNLEWVYGKNMPDRLLSRTVFLHGIYGALSFLFFSAGRRGGIYVKAKLDAARGWKRMMVKRKSIQERRIISDTETVALLDQETFFSRFTMRLKRKGENDK